MDDLISRQAALEKVRAMQTYKLFMGDDMILIDKAEVQTELMMLPTVQPERAAGEWIVHLYKVGVSRYECDTCHARCDIIYPYCPYCGEKKEGERYAIN